jgi:hypothetical protein
MNNHLAAVQKALLAGKAGRNRHLLSISRIAIPWILQEAENNFFGVSSRK